MGSEISKCSDGSSSMSMINPVTLLLHISLVLVESDNLVPIVMHLIEETVGSPIFSQFHSLIHGVGVGQLCANMSNHCLSVISSIDEIFVFDHLKVSNLSPVVDVVACFLICGLLGSGGFILSFFSCGLSECLFIRCFLSGSLSISFSFGSLLSNSFLLLCLFFT